MAKAESSPMPVMQKSGSTGGNRWWEDTGLGEYAAEVAAEMVALQAKRARIDSDIKERSLVLQALMEEVNDKEGWGCYGQGWSASYVKPAPRKTLVAERLIGAGVTLEQIEKGTRETPVKPHVRVRARNDNS